MVLDERQGHLGRGCIAQPRHREGLGFLECLHECTWQPRMAIRERLPDTQRVHHWEHFRSRVPVGCAFMRIFEQVLDLGMSTVET